MSDVSALIEEARADLVNLHNLQLHSKTVRGLPALANRLADALEAAEARTAELERTLHDSYLPGSRQRAAVNRFIDQNMDAYPVESAHGVGWHEADCNCGWRTSGNEYVVDEAVWEHAFEHLDTTDRIRSQQAEAQLEAIRHWNDSIGHDGMAYSAQLDAILNPPDQHLLTPAEVGQIEDAIDQETP